MRNPAYFGVPNLSTFAMLGRSPFQPNPAGGHIGFSPIITRATQVGIVSESIRLVTPDVAVEDGRVRFIAPIGPADTTSYTAIYVREENEWKLDSIRETASLAPPSNYDLLSQWEWMVGNWTDELDDWKVESSCRWSANRNFLTRTFEVSRDGDLQVQGTQVIGYDPVVSVFKCWTFHSGGGSGEGTLEMKDGRWVVAAAGDASLTSEPGYFPVRRSKEGKWSIDTIGEVSFPLASPDEKRMEELQWMVGRWVDKDGDATITTTGSWTPNKAFLQRSFKVVVQDRVGLAGMQVIGWDADAKKFCSWVFDSSGGFANEEWSKESDHWIVRFAGVLFGGRKVSSVRIITPIDDNTLTLEVVDRDGGGELLPDIDKVTIVRDQPNE